MKRSHFFKIVGLILVLFVFLGAEKKKKKPKKVWFPQIVSKLDLTQDQVKKLQNLDCYKKMLATRNEMTKKGLKYNTDEGKKFRKNNNWQDNMKKFRDECKNILTKDQLKKQKELQSKNKKPKKK